VYPGQSGGGLEGAKSLAQTSFCWSELWSVAPGHFLAVTGLRWQLCLFLRNRPLTCRMRQGPVLRPTGTAWGWSRSGGPFWLWPFRSEAPSRDAEWVTDQLCNQVEHSQKHRSERLGLLGLWLLVRLCFAQEQRIWSRRIIQCLRQEFSCHHLSVEPIYRLAVPSIFHPILQPIRKNEPQAIIDRMRPDPTPQRQRTAWCRRLFFKPKATTAAWSDASRGQSPADEECRVNRAPLILAIWFNRHHHVQVHLLVSPALRPVLWRPAGLLQIQSAWPTAGRLQSQQHAALCQQQWAIL